MWRTQKTDSFPSVSRMRHHPWEKSIQILAHFPGAETEAVGSASAPVGTPFPGDTASLYSKHVRFSAACLVYLSLTCLLYGLPLGSPSTASDLAPGHPWSGSGSLLTPSPTW